MMMDESTAEISVPHADDEALIRENSIRLCKNCQAKPIDDENPHSILCTECRKGYIKFRLPKSIYAFCGLLALLVVVSAISFAQVLPNYKELKETDQAFLNNAYVTAQKGYTSLLDKYPNSKEISQNLFYSAIQNGDYETADRIASDKISGQKLDDATYAKVDQYYNIMDGLYTDSEKVSKAIESVDKTDIAKMIDAVSNIPESGNSAYMQDTLGALYASEGAYDKALAYCQKSVKLQPIYPLAWVDLTACYRRSNDFDNARKTANDALKINSENAQVLRQLAVIEFLQNHLDSAYSAASKAYALEPDGTYIAQTLCVVYSLQGKTTERDALKAKVQATHKDEFDSDYDDIVSGKKTVQDVYVSMNRS